MQGRPYPKDPSEKDRCEEGELRLRMLEGAWRDDLDEALNEFFAPEVIARIESARDISRAPYASAMNQINTLYQDDPTVSIRGATDATEPDDDAEEPDPAPLLAPELWAARQQGQLWTLGLGEAATRVDLVTEPGGARRLTYRAIPGCLLQVRCSPSDPRRIVEVIETRPPDGNGKWRRETHRAYPARGDAPATGSFTVEEYDTNPGGGWVDVTANAITDFGEGGKVGDPLYSDDDGPIMPYALHHLTLGRSTWSWRRWSELVQAQLYVGCLRTFWLAGFRDNAHPIRYGIDIILPGIAPEGGPGTAGPARLLLDPSVFLEIHTRSGINQTGSVGTLEPTMHIGDALRGIDDYIAGALQDAGLGPADEAPARGVSATAIVVSRESRRTSQRQQTPAARLGDQQLLAAAARIWNKYGGGAKLPTDPAAYAISYRGIPLSTEEVRSIVDRVTALLNARLTTRARAILEVHPQMSPAEARQLAAEIDAETREEQRRNAPQRAAPERPQQPADPEDDAEDDVEDPEPATS